MKSFSLVILYLCLSVPGFTQQLLDKVVPLHVQELPVPEVLKTIGQQGSFFFSYNNALIRAEQKITINEDNKTVRQLLDLIFEGTLQYKEQGKYIILQSGKERSYVISGYIQDGKTGEKISNATVYETNLLTSTLTNENGYFKLPIKNRDKHTTASLTVSKEHYYDMSMTLNAGYDQEVMVPIMQNMDLTLDSFEVKTAVKIETNWLAQLFLSSKQKMQSINIRHFIANRPIQTSLLPGLGTHGRLGAQVVNKFSLNILGGYTAGVNGAEIGSLFNIDKKNVQYAQVAGLFNIVGGGMRGGQAAGLYNTVLDSVNGVQLAGLANFDRGGFKGAATSGIYNHVQGAAKGVLVSGIANYNNDSLKGVQVSGLINLARKEIQGVQVASLANYSHSIKGVQVSGLINCAHNVKGVQIGLINITDSLSGYSIGLINYARKGYHTIAFSSNEMQQICFAYKSGSGKLYSIITGGMNFGNENKAFSFGYGVGRNFVLGKHWGLTAEFTTQAFYLGSWEESPTVWRLQTAFYYRPVPFITLYAGPAYSFADGQEFAGAKGYMNKITDNGWSVHHFDPDISGLIGWQIGISIF